jgi:hypothetical protein
MLVIGLEGIRDREREDVEDARRNKEPGSSREEAGCLVGGENVSGSRFGLRSRSHNDDEFREFAHVHTVSASVLSTRK